jgi:phospholipid transport system substrate-binding protein
MSVMHRRPPSLTRRGVLLGLALTGFVAAPSVLRAATLDDVGKPIAELNAGLLQAMRAGTKTAFASRFEALTPLVDRAFDLPGILRASVGQHWTGLVEQDRSDLQDIFRRFTIASYVASFNAFDGERFELLPELRAVGTDQVVGTLLVPATGEPIRLDYVMRQQDGVWRAVDVLADGTISRVAVQRSDFRALLAQGGVRALIGSLQKKLADLSGGSLV